MINKVVHDTHKSGERPGLWKNSFFSPPLRDRSDIAKSPHWRKELKHSPTLFHNSKRDWKKMGRIMLADDWDNPQQFPAIYAQQEGSSSANNDGIPQQSVWREILPGESCLLTVGHSWVVFYQHPKQQRGSSVWGVVHLPWLFCWWRHCPPTSRVRFFPSFFNCDDVNMLGRIEHEFVLLKLGNQEKSQLEAEECLSQDPIIENARFLQTNLR